MTHSFPAWVQRPNSKVKHLFLSSELVLVGDPVLMLGTDESGTQPVYSCLSFPNVSSVFSQSDLHREIQTTLSKITLVQTLT